MAQRQLTVLKIWQSYLHPQIWAHEALIAKLGKDCSLPAAALPKTKKAAGTPKAAGQEAVQIYLW